MEGKGYFSRSVCMGALRCRLPGSGAGRALSHRKCVRRGGQRALPAPTVAQVSSAQHNIPKWHVLGWHTLNTSTPVTASRGDIALRWSPWSTGLGPVGCENFLSLCANYNTNIF